MTKEQKITIDNLTKKCNRYKQTLEIFGYKFKLCWLCGKKTDITQHHIKSIKKHGRNCYKIPLCEKHHQLIENIKDAIEIMEKEKRLSITRFKQLLKTMERIKVK